MKKWLAKLFVLILCLSGFMCSEKPELDDVSDLVLLGGKVVTIDGQESIAEAVAVRSGKIIAVGENKEIEKLIGENTKVIDLKGRTVIPGLIDSHCHITSTATGMKGVVDLSQEAGVQSISDIKAKIAEKAETIPKGEWIRGAREDDYKLEEKRHPTRRELDEAAPDNPVIISTVGGHFSIVNSKAFEAAGVTEDTPDPVGGEFDRNAETGELTGGAHEEAVSIIRQAMPQSEDLSREEVAETVKQMMMENAAVGLTCIYDNVGRVQIRAALDLRGRVSFQ